MSLPLLCLVMIATGAAQGDQPPARPAVVVASGGIEVLNLDPDNLQTLRAWDRSSPKWQELLTLTLRPSDRLPAPPNLPGTYHIIGAALRFDPKFPIEPALFHRARFDPAKLPTPRPNLAAITFDFEQKPPPKAEPTRLVRVDPTSDHVPENLLKLYLHFSAPMSRGEAYHRVQLLDSAQKPLILPFLELGEELWDPTGTRLTLLFDPGRIKRGLRPREEDGPILEAGKTYTLTVDRRWPDAHGEPLDQEFRRVFHVGPAQEGRIDVALWKIEAPKQGSRQPLAMSYPKPLDRALLDHAFTIVDASGQTIAGQVEIDNDATRWQFRPESTWKPGDFVIKIDPNLEDISGNSVARAFEVDMVGPQVDPPPPVLRFQVR